MSTPALLCRYGCRCLAMVSYKEIPRNMLFRKSLVKNIRTPNMVLFVNNRLYLHTTSFNYATKKAKAKKKGLTASNSKIDFSIADGIFDMKETQQKMETQIQKCTEGMMKFSPKLNLASIGDIYVKVNGRKSKLYEVASITTTNKNEFVITPMLKTGEAFNEVLSSLSQTNLKLNPISDGNVIKIPVPLASSERRDVLLKEAKSHTESIKVAVRKIRQQALVDLRKIKDDVSKDDVKRIEQQIQLLTDKYSKEVDQIFKNKESELTL